MTGKHSTQPVQAPAGQKSREPWRARVKRWIDEFYELDKRVDALLRRNPTATQLAWVLWFVLLWAAVAGIGFVSYVLAWHSRPIGFIVIMLGLSCVMTIATIAACRKMRQQLLDERRRSGQCLVCGYDLRETPDRCPECGTVVDWQTHC